MNYVVQDIVLPKYQRQRPCPRCILLTKVFKNNSKLFNRQLNQTHVDN